MFEPLLARWVKASLAILVKSTADSLGLKFFVEGVDREKPEWFRQDSCVLRVVGPTPKFGSGRTRYKFEAMVMLTDLVDDAENGFLNDDRLGTLGNTLQAPVPVLKYGGDQSQVGCLDIDRDSDDFLRLVNFGKLDKDSEVVQGAVIVKYEICLDV